MNRFSFLHAADLHLDSPLANLDLGGDDEARTLVRAATRRAFVRLIDHALDKRVAFVVIAGDLWDGAWPDVHTGLWFVREVNRLAEAAIPLVWLRGNHDAESEVTPLLRWPAHVHELATRAPSSVKLERWRAVLHGQGFAERQVTTNLAANYPPPAAGWLNIGVLHTALDGAEGHAPYAPCTLQELVAKGYDYWALGHVHGFAVRHERPWVVYPGCLQGRHANETGAKGAVEVEVEDQHVVAVRPVPLDVVRWLRPRIDLTGVVELETVEARVLEALHLDTASLVANVELVVARPSLRGRTPLASALTADRRRLGDRLQALALTTSPRTVIETLELALAAPAATPPHLADDAVAELEAALARLAASDEIAGYLAQKVAEIRRRVPAEVVAQLESGPLAALFAGDHGDFLRARIAAARSLLEDAASEADAAG